MIKYIDWDGEDLTGLWEFTIKKDGICAFRTPFSAITKGGKHINNLPKDLKDFEMAEVFCGSWNKTMSIAMASKSKRRRIRNSEIFTILPTIDPRLYLGTFLNPRASTIEKIFKSVLKRGHEGLVLRQGDLFIKVKPEYTLDVKILDIVERKTDKGVLKEFITDRGKVGTGFTKAQRIRYFDKRIIGYMIEVKCTGFTVNDKLLHGRFVRLRRDKS